MKRLFSEGYFFKTITDGFITSAPESKVLPLSTMVRQQTEDLWPFNFAVRSADIQALSLKLLETAAPEGATHCAFCKHVGWIT